MPKPSQTMLDKLAETFKSVGKTAPFREMKLHGEFTDPMVKARANQQLAGNKLIKVDPSWRTPERVKYQRGLEAIQNRDVMNAQNQLDDLESDKELLQSQWDDAVAEAKDAMAEDWRTGLDDNDFSEIDPDYLEVETPSTDLADYWPDYGYMSPREFGQRAERLDEDISDWEDIVGHRESPAYRMELQRQSPRYRNYQRAMRQREYNARLGRINAEIMNLYRQGYSMPEIREILRNQRMR